MVGGLQASTRFRRALAAASVMLLLTGAGVAYVRQEAQVVSVDDALEGYRRMAASTTTTSQTAVAADGNGPAVGDHPAPTVGASTPAGMSSAGGPAAPVAPTTIAPPGPESRPARAEMAEGVYTMATSGYEETSALGGSRHDYPDETALTIRKVECGYVQRWQPLAERWDESELCHEPEGFSVRRFSAYHEFFQRGQRQDFTCPAGSYVYKPSANPGDRWPWRCGNEGGTIDTIATFIGFEDVDIGGTRVRAARMRYESTLSGANRGTQLQDRWLHVDTGFNLRIKTDVDLEAESPFGPVHYEERYTITAASLTPKR